MTARNREFVLMVFGLPFCFLLVVLVVIYLIHSGHRACSDTAEGNAVAHVLIPHLSLSSDQNGLKEAERIGEWAEHNTAGETRTAWLCWVEYYRKDFEEKVRARQVEKSLILPPGLPAR